MRDKQSEKPVTLVAEQGEASNNFFMARSSSGASLPSVCSIESRCSNHMTADKSLFSNLDKSQKVSVRLGNNKEMIFQGVGIVSVCTQSGEQKQLQGVQFVPVLAYSLLSVGQLHTKRYSVLFNKDKCFISDKKMKKQ